MEAELLYLSLFILSLFVALNFIRSKTRKVENLPPSPPSLPIIGHLHLLKDPIHQTLHNLSQKHGPIISLKFGSRPVFVVESSSAVEECFTSNDIILANRPRLIIGKHVGYNWSVLVNANYGEHWRHLRKICSVEILSSNRLNLFTEVRKQEVKNLIGNIYRESKVLNCGSYKDNNKVELRPLLTELPFNIIVRMICGKKKFEEGEGEEARTFRVLIKEILGVAAATYPGDFLSILRWIDYQGFENKAKELAKRSDEFFQGLVDEHKDKRRSQYLGLENTLIDRLLSLQESDPMYYSDEVIKGLILALLLAGTDTSSVAMEWAMSLLLNHPEVLRTLKDEINTHLRHDNRLVEEADLPKLTYLQCVISETLRLYPPTPLLLPHVASQDCKIQGFDMPRDTMVLVNAWAIHRDPDLWNEPEKFKPERFRDVNNDDDVSYKYIPFGVGRRACPGAGLGNRVMALALASMIQCFDWERPSHEEEIDMTQGRGLTMPKAKPLQAVCRPTPIINHIFGLQT